MFTEYDENITVDELKRYLRIGTTSVYKLIHSEGFPAIRVSPRRIIIPKAALDDWMKRNVDKAKEGRT